MDKEADLLRHRSLVLRIKQEKEEQAAYKNRKDPRYNPALYAAIKLMLCSLFGRCTMRNETDSQELVTRSELGGLLDRAKKQKQALEYLKISTCSAPTSSIILGFTYAGARRAISEDRPLYAGLT